MWASLCAGIAALHAGSPSIVPMELHELIARADLCVVGRIERVDPVTIEVDVSQVGFGRPQGEHVTVKRFRDWTCVQRWTEYAPGQRCLYFLAGQGGKEPYEILGAGGEGERPIQIDGTVDVCRFTTDPRARNVHLKAVLEEALRYRERFRRSPGGRWFEPRVNEAELEAYQRSSPLAAYLCARTFRGTLLGKYRDPAGRPPRSRGAVPRLDLGVGPPVQALAALPDFDRDGSAELIVWDGGLLMRLQSGEDGEVRDRSVIDADVRGCTALASLGDLDGDGTQELAAGLGGKVRILSLDAGGLVAQKRSILPSRWLLGEEVAPVGRFGQGLASLGDIDRDGTAELAVSAGDGSAASIWLVSLAPDGRADRALGLLRAVEGVPGPLALAALGDVDGDGAADLAVGAQGMNGNIGAVEVFFLAHDGTVLHRERITNEHRGRSFGCAVAGIGDHDGDGVPDLAVGTQASPVRLLFLTRTGAVREERVLQPDETPMDEDSLFGVELCVLPLAKGGQRLLCTGTSWLERPTSEVSGYRLRNYLSLWGFDLPVAGGR